MTKTLICVVLAAALAYFVGTQVQRRQDLKERAFSPVLPARLPSAVDRSPTAATSPAPAATDTPGVADGETSQLAGAIEVLCSSKATFAQKQEVLAQLRKSGKLDEAIAALKKLQEDSPGDASVNTALGEALLRKVAALSSSGGESNEIAIMAMQADQAFSSALKTEPTNWEAQFEKEAALAHWPVALGKGPEVVDAFNKLITQQDASPPKPEYALSYAVLGDQLAALGRGDEALQVWKTGASQYPMSAQLSDRISRASNP